MKVITILFYKISVLLKHWILTTLVFYMHINSHAAIPLSYFSHVQTSYRHTILFFFTVMEILKGNGNISASRSHNFWQSKYKTSMRERDLPKLKKGKTSRNRKRSSRSNNTSSSCFMLLPEKKKWRSQKKKSKMRSEKTKNSKRKEKTCSRYENFPNELPQVDPPSWKSCISKYSDGKKHSTIISLKFYKKIINIRLGNSIMSSKNYDNVIRWHSDHFDVYVLDLKKHGRQRQKEFP